MQANAGPPKSPESVEREELVGWFNQGSGRLSGQSQARAARSAMEGSGTPGAIAVILFQEQGRVQAA